MDGPRGLRDSACKDDTRLPSKWLVREFWKISKFRMMVIGTLGEVLGSIDADQISPPHLTSPVCTPVAPKPGAFFYPCNLNGDRWS